MESRCDFNALDVVMCDRSSEAPVDVSSASLSSSEV